MLRKFKTFGNLEGVVGGERDFVSTDSVTSKIHKGIIKWEN